MNQVTQGTAASAEEAASASEEMTGQAEEMRSLVNAFQLSTTQAQSRAVRPAPASRAVAPVQRKVSAPVVAKRPAPAMAKANGNGNGNGHLKADARKVIPFDDDDTALAEF